MHRVVETYKPRMQRLNPPKSRKVELALQNPLMIQREINNRSFFEFFKYFWGVYSEETLIANWHIEDICNELQEVAERVAANQPKEYDLIINVPPGSSKTSIVMVMFPVWCWTKWYWFRFITSSYAQTLSLESAEYSRDIIKNERFTEMYPELAIKDDKDSKSNYKIIRLKRSQKLRPPKMRVGGNRFSTSVGSAVTGFHGHILLVDDPLNPHQANSEVQIETANKYISETLGLRKIDKAVTPIIMIMQRLHQNDPTGAWLAKAKEQGKKIKHICLPGDISNPQIKELVSPKEYINKYTNDLLDPARMSKEVLHDIKIDLGQYAYAGQVLQNPTPAGGGMFKVDKFRSLSSISETNIVATVRYWDKAGSDGKGAYTAGVKMSKMQNGTFIIHDVVRGQWSSEKRERIIKQTAELDGRDCVVWIEQEPGSGGKESAENTIRNLAGFVCKKEHPTGDKVYRADPLSVQVNESNVVLIEGGWNVAFKEELRFFPYSKYKDQTDAAAGAFNALRKRKRARTI